MDELDVSSFEESSNESDICSLGSDDLDRSEPSAEVYHDSTSCDGQGDLVERTSLGKEQAGSGDDPSDLESDEEVSKIMQVSLTKAIMLLFLVPRPHAFAWQFPDV